MECKIAQDWQENHPAKIIRTKVFMEEQGFTSEFDEIDPMAYHALILDGDQAVACGRLYQKAEAPDTYLLGRIAVLPEYRKQHLGAKILEILENQIKDLNGKMAELSAQISAVGFYEKCGYHKQGDVYFDEHCQHIKMIKYL